MEIREIFEEFVNNELNKERFYSLIGKAVNVDPDKRICDFEPIDDIATREGVRLQSVISETKGFVLIPKENSDIIVTFLNRSTGFVSLTSELEKIIWDADSTQVNGGDNGGLINIQPLINKINQLENALNNHIAIFNSHIHITTATVAATPTPGIIAPTTPGDTTNTITPITQKSDLEDTKFTH